MNRLLIGFVTTLILVSCGGDNGVSPISNEQEVKFAFVMLKQEWYDCSIAVQGNTNRSIQLYLNQRHVGSLTCAAGTGTDRIKDERFEMFVKPGRYAYSANGRDWQNRVLSWSGETLANYPFGATIFLGCSR